MEVSDKQFDEIYKTGYKTGHVLGYQSALRISNLGLSMMKLEIDSLLDDLLDYEDEKREEIKNIIQKYKDINQREINEITNNYNKENNNE